MNMAFKEMLKLRQHLNMSQADMAMYKVSCFEISGYFLVTFV
jgi:hypothetical protein